MNTYVAFYNDKRIDIHANTLWEAQEKAEEVFNAHGKKSWKIHIVLAEVNGQPVVHIADI